MGKTPVWKGKSLIMDFLKRNTVERTFASKEEMPFDAMMFQGEGTIYIWIDGLMYQLELTKPVKQLPQPK